jgi:hypothetical protein
MLTEEQMRDKIIAASVKDMIQFGYPQADKENIFTDAVYSLMFKTMLVRYKGNSDKLDKIIDDLLKDIKEDGK